MLEANRVELVVAEDDRLTVHASDGGVSKANLPLAGGVSESIQTYLASSVAPSQVKVIGTGGDARGFLVVYRTEPLSDGEQALVDALGGQIAVMLQNHQLFFETLEHAQLLDIIADSSDGIFVLSPEHRVLSWNPAMENMSGLAAGDVVGRGIDELLDVHAFNDGTQAEGGMLGETGDAVIAGRAADRTWIRYTRNPIRDRDGALKAYVVVARDVTAEMQAEQMKRDFVATVSHELRTPLTPLKGFLTTLMRGHRRGHARGAAGVLPDHAEPDQPARAADHRPARGVADRGRQVAGRHPPHGALLGAGRAGEGVLGVPARPLDRRPHAEEPGDRLRRPVPRRAGHREPRVERAEVLASRGARVGEPAR